MAIRSDKKLNNVEKGKKRFLKLYRTYEDMKVRNEDLDTLRQTFLDSGIYVIGITTITNYACGLNMQPLLPLYLGLAGSLYTAIPYGISLCFVDRVKAKMLKIIHNDNNFPLDIEIYDTYQTIMQLYGDSNNDNRQICYDIEQIIEQYYQSVTQEPGISRVKSNHRS